MSCVTLPLYYVHTNPVVIGKCQKFKTQKVCGNTIWPDQTTCLVFFLNIYLFFFVKCKIISMFFPSYDNASGI